MAKFRVVSPAREKKKHFVYHEPPLPILSDIMSFPESSFPLLSGRKTSASGSNHFEITKEKTEFCTSGFTAQSASMAYACNGYPPAELSFSYRWSRGTKILGTRLLSTISERKKNIMSMRKC